MIATILMTIQILSSEPKDEIFSQWKHCYKMNQIFYDVALSTDDELTDLMKTHLYALRFLIDLKLRDFTSASTDYKRLYEFSQNDKYLWEELTRKYCPRN